MANIKEVIQQMIDDGQPQENIQAVVDKYKAQKTGKTSDPVNVEATAGSKEDMASQSESGSLVSSLGKFTGITSTATDQGVDPDDFENTQDKSTYLEDLFGKNHVTDFIGDFYRAGKGGIIQAQSLEPSLKLFSEGGNMSDEDFQNLVEKGRAMEEYGQTDEMLAFNERYNEIQKSSQELMFGDDEGLSGFAGSTLAFMRGWWENPSVMAQYSAQSLANMAYSGITNPGKMLAGASAGAGSALVLGQLGPQVGLPEELVTVPTAAIAGAMASISATMETGFTTAELIQNEAEKAGLNWAEMDDADRVAWYKKVANNEELYDDLTDKALARGLTIGAIDGLTALAVPGGSKAISSRVAMGAGSKLTGAVRVGSGAAIETGGGMASEYLGQKAAGQETNAQEILIEGFADKSLTAIETGKALYNKSPKYTINGEELNGKEFQRALKLMDDEAYVGADIKVENSDVMENLVNNRINNINLDQKVDSRINDSNDRSTVIKLIKEQESLSKNKEGNATRLTEIQEEINSINEKYKGNKVDVTIEQRKQAVAKAIDDKFEASFNKNLKAAKEAAAKKDTTIDVFEDDDAYYNKIAENQNITPQEAKTKAKGSDGVFVGKGQIFINKAQAKKVGAVGVASHEFLHPVLNAAIGNSKQQGKIVSDFKKSLTSKQRAYVDKKLKANYDPSQWNTEYLNIFSDGIQNGDINYDQTLFEKIGESIKRFFVGQGFDNISFDSGRDVYNFLKEYNTSIKQEGKVSEKAMDAITAAEQKTGRKVGSVETAGNMQMSRTEDVAEVNNIYDTTPDKVQAGFEIAEKYRGMAESVFKQLRDGQNLTPDQQNVLDQNKDDIIAMMLYDKIPTQRKGSKARNVLGLVQDFVKEKQKYGNVAAYINTFFKQRSKEVTQYFVPDAMLEGLENQEGNIKKSVLNKTTTEVKKDQGPSARKISSFEKLTIDGQDFYSPVMKTKVAGKVAANIAIGTKKGLKVDSVLKSIQQDVEGSIKDTIKKSMGKVQSVKGKVTISPEYQSFLDQSYNTFVKSLPLSTIKRRYGKLFKLKKLGREETAVGKGVYEMTKPSKQEFNDFFTKGGYTTLIEKQKKFAQAMAEEFTANETSNLVADTNFLNKISTLLDINNMFIAEAQLKQLVDDIAKAQDRKSIESRGFDTTLQFSQTMSETGQTDNVVNALKSQNALDIFKQEFKHWRNKIALDGKKPAYNWLERSLKKALKNKLPKATSKQVATIAKELSRKHKELATSISFIAQNKGVDVAVDQLIDFIIDPNGNVSVGVVNDRLGIKSKYDGRSLSQVNEGRAAVKMLLDGIVDEDGKVIVEGLTTAEFIRAIYQGVANPARLAGFEVGLKTSLLLVAADVIQKASVVRPSLFSGTNDINTNLDLKDTKGGFRDANQTKKDWFFSNKYNKLSDTEKKAFTKKLYESSKKDQVIFLKSMKILREGVKQNEVNPEAVEAVLYSMFGSMVGVGKAMAGPRFLMVDIESGALLTMEDAYKKGLAYKNDVGVLEHMKPADYIKGLSYNYVMTGEGLSILESELDSYDTSVIPKRVDDIIRARGNQSFMGPIFKPGVDIFSAGQRYNALGIAFYDVSTGKIIDSGLQFSKTDPKRTDLNKAIELARDPNKKPKGISVFDFDDTLAQTNSKVIVKMADGSKMEIDATRFALESADLEAAGALFDFTQFNEVIDGKKGPLADLALKRQGKFGSKDIFVLTARPQEAAIAIHAWLKGIGLTIPIDNITGLADGKPSAKADWVINKASKGYNDFYFADDAYKNVKAVQDVLSQIDVKSDVQQAKVQFSRTMNEQFNDILEQTKGVKSEKKFSDAAAKARGSKKGNFFKQLFVPPSAEDFVGLLYSFLAKGKLGEQQMAFFEKALIKPFARAMQELASARQVYATGLRNLKKAFPDVTKKLAKPTKYNNFNYDTAIRTYIWAKLGYEISGMSKADVKRLTQLVESDTQLKAFADGLIDLTKDRNYVKPGESWLAGNIATDIKDITDKVGRKEFLKEWLQNKNVIFSKENMNKIEAEYGSNFREALEDILFRMENGTNRNFGSNSSLVNSFTNWVNNSVGAIMFFNIRSAVLQTISAVNFVNWTDNNPLAAGKALLNIKQFAADFAMIFNSDMLQQRRRGIGRDINESEIAEAMYGKKNKAKAILNYLLRIGFTPTQIADSFAIASGGAAFYRNRVNTYISKGLSKAEAQKQAFVDFAEISEKTQQSARPDLISQQQAGPLGRLILAFGNTPMQYTRLIKKAFLDLVNGRGDKKTNISKIAYYAFIQNIIFASLQSAMFALMFRDDEEDDDFADNKKERVANTMVDTLLRGTGVYGAGIATIKNMIKQFLRQEEKGFTADHTYTIMEAVNLSPPVGSKLRKLYSAIQTYKFNKDVISHKGFSLDNPAYQAGGNVVSALTNVPLDRLFNKMNNLKASMNSNNEAWQRIALALGWNTWDLDAELDPELAKLKEFLKKKRKADKRLDPKYQQERLKELLKKRKQKLKSLKK